jgi:phytoene/squalene synthetase
MNTTNHTSGLAASITKAASRQAYYTIHFLADRDRVADAYRAYAYFRWVDDVLDAEEGSMVARRAFVRRQESLLEKCYRGELLPDAHPEEEMLVQLVRIDTEKNSGLQFYLRNMMAVMAFDVERRGRLISQTELDAYTYWLAGAVTEAMHYFIGHDDYSAHSEARPLAVTAAHITHMLRDAFEDAQAGYFNIPHEVLDANHIAPLDVQSGAYRTWVRSRVDLARRYFKRSRQYLNEVENLRCRLAGFAYVARFEWLLNTIEKEGYCLRSQYNERKKFGAGLRMGWLAFSSMLASRHANLSPQTIPMRRRISR